MYSNNILNFQKSAPILNACTKNVWKRIEGTTYLYIEEKPLKITHIFCNNISADPILFLNVRSASSDKDIIIIISLSEDVDLILKKILGLLL